MLPKKPRSMSPPSATTSGPGNEARPAIPQPQASACYSWGPDSYTYVAFVDLDNVLDSTLR